MLQIDSKKERAIINDIANFVIHARKENTSAPLSTIFDQTWAYISSNYIHHDDWKKGGAPSIENWFYINFQLDLKEYFLLTLVIIFQKLGAKDFAPKVIAKTSPDLSSLLQDTKSSVVVTTHNGFSFPGFLLGEHGKNVTTISSHPDIEQIFKRTGVKKKLSVVRNDLYSLVRLQEKIKLGDTIVVAIDYSSENGKYVYVSDGLFEFADMNQLRSFFAVSEVMEDGSVQVNFLESSNSLSSLEKAQALIDFTNEHRQFKKDLNVRSLRNR